MSPRAACRLAGLGFEQVHDYVPGKVDWLARGLDRQGDKAAERRAVDAARDDAVTAAPGERVGDVRARVEPSPYGFALVVAEGGTVQGRLRAAVLAGDPDARAEDVMEPGPSTVRADLPATELRERLEARDLRFALVTTPEGRLLGVVRRDEL